MLKTVFFQLLLLTGGVLGRDTHNFSYELLPETRISISGTSNVKNFRCLTAESNQKGSFIVFEKDDSSAISFYNAKLPVRVRSLDCNNNLINRDLYKTLNADRYPFILLQLRDADLISSYPNNTYKYKVKVDLTLANNQRESNGEVLVQKIGAGVFRITGSQHIKLTDFSIKPPTAMLGLIVVDDEMVINFNVVVKVKKDLLGN